MDYGMRRLSSPSRRRVEACAPSDCEKSPDGFLRISTECNETGSARESVRSRRGGTSDEGVAVQPS